MCGSTYEINLELVAAMQTIALQELAETGKLQLATPCRLLQAEREDEMHAIGPTYTDLTTDFIDAVIWLLTQSWYQMDKRVL